MEDRGVYSSVVLYPSDNIRQNIGMCLLTKCEVSLKECDKVQSSCFCLEPVCACVRIPVCGCDSMSVFAASCV